MVYLFLCDACKRGDHNHCSKGFPAKNGQYGGSKCNCFAANHHRDNSEESRYDKITPPDLNELLNKNFWNLL